MIYRAKVSHPALGWFERLIEAESAAGAVIKIVGLAIGAARGPDYDNAILEHALIVSVSIDPAGSTRGETSIA